MQQLFTTCHHDLPLKSIGDFPDADADIDALNRFKKLYQVAEFGSGNRVISTAETLLSQHLYLVLSWSHAMMPNVSRPNDIWPKILHSKEWHKLTVHIANTTNT